MTQNKDILNSFSLLNNNTTVKKIKGVAAQKGVATKKGVGSTWVGGPLKISGKVSVGKNKDGRLEVFARDPSNILWFKRQTSNGNWSGWTSLGDIRIISNPVANITQFGCLDVFAIGADGKVWRRWQTTPGGEQWTAWTLFPGNMTFTGELAVEQNTDGRLEVFAKGTDNSIYHIWQLEPNGVWSNWYSLGGPFLGNPVVIKFADGNIDLFVRGMNNIVWRRWQMAPGSSQWSDSWVSWHEASIVGDIAVGKNSDGRMEAFARSTNNKLLSKYQITPIGAWTNWVESTYGSVISNPAVSTTVDGILELFAICLDRVVVYKWQVNPGSSTSWTDWNAFSPSNPHMTSVKGEIEVARYSDSRLDVFAVDDMNTLWHTYELKPNGQWSGWISLDN